MAFREVTMLEIKEVLRRWLRGETKSEISRQCGLSRVTARSYIRAAEEGGLSPGQGDGVLDDDEWLAALCARLHPSSGRPRGEGWRVCEKHQEYISKKLEGRVRLTKIRKLLRRQKGVRVSYATLRRFAVGRLGFGRGRGTIPVADGEPGKEIQLDTGWVGRLKADLTGRRRRFRDRPGEARGDHRRGRGLHRKGWRPEQRADRHGHSRLRRRRKPAPGRRTGGARSRGPSIGGLLRRGLHRGRLRGIQRDGMEMTMNTKVANKFFFSGFVAIAFLLSSNLQARSGLPDFTELAREEYLVKNAGQRG